MRILIVGRGYAGCLLSYFLIKKDIQVTIVDNNEHSTSTRVSAGIILPVTGRRLAKTYKADEVIPFAMNIYRKVEQETGITFFHQKDVLQLFTDNGNRNEWFARSSDDDLEGYTGDILSNEEVSPAINNSTGGIILKQSGYAIPAELIKAFEAVETEKQTHITEQFNHRDLKFSTNGVEWKNTLYDYVIFCEGYKCTSNPYFSFIPFKPAKGEIIDFSAPLLDENYIINGNVFILPVGDGNFRAGSTYDWEDLTSNPTQKGKEELLEGLNKLINCNIEITGHKAGVRPSIKDRRPVIGFHPEHKLMGIFNGLGTKGVMLAPYFANQFCEAITSGGKIENDVNVSRFYSLHPKQ